MPIDNSLVSSSWLLLFIFIVGCDGCKRLEVSQKNTNNDEELAERIAFEEFRVLPTSRDRSINYVKAGHWAQFRQAMKANKFDEALTAELTLVDSSFQPITYRGSELVSFSRDVTIAKAQSKHSEFLAMVPDSAEFERDYQTHRSMTKLTYMDRNLGATVAEQAYPYSLLKPEQYLLLVISREPERHSFWRRLNAIVFPSEFKLEDEKTVSYRVIELGEDDARVSLPNNLLTWTAISHLVLYDANLENLSDAQKEAIVDWLHFGGTIILSGPDALAALSNSFLSPYFPLTGIQTVEASSEAIQQLNKHWAIASSGLKPVELNHLEVPVSRKLTILDGEPNQNAAWLKSANGLVVDRRVGAGRLCMTTFSMSDDLFVRWRCYGSFVNGALLRRPPRAWTYQSAAGVSELVCIPEFANAEKNGRFATKLRLLSRDISVSAMNRKEQSPSSAHKEEFQEADRPMLASSQQVEAPNVSHFRNFVTSFDRGDGMKSLNAPGRWNDNSGIAQAAAQLLSEASGIAIPRVRRIIQLLSFYLVALVPVNWIIFRLVGRLEWAWLSAPLLAVVGAVWIARSVQLDIGFTRSENRISVLELHQAHHRGHLASFTSLYTSLSTQYDLLYPKSNGVILPFVPREQPLTRFGPRNVRFRYQSNQGDGLQRISILSNTTSRFHGEEIIDVGGAITAQFDSTNPKKLRLVNGTNINIRFAAISGKTVNQEWVKAWCGDLQSGATIDVELEAIKTPVDWFDQWDSNPVTSRNPTSSTIRGSDGEASSAMQLRVDRMLHQVLNGFDFLPGHVVLIGYSDQQLASLVVTPTANQFTNCNVVVAHVNYPDFPEARPDRDLVPLKTEQILQEEQEAAPNSDEEALPELLEISLPQ